MKNIGIDIGGTSIKGAVIENGTVTARAKRSTDISRGLDSIRDCLFAVIKDLLPLAGADAGIGIGSAGDIDPYEGKVLYATGNLPGFTGFEIKKDVENKFNRPCRSCIRARRCAGECDLSAPRGSWLP